MMTFRKLAYLFVLVSILIFSCKDDKKESGKEQKGKDEARKEAPQKKEFTKEEVLKFYDSLLAYYKTPEYGEMLAKYKEATAGMKDVMERQKKFDEIMGPSKKKVEELMKTLGVSDMFQLMDAANKFKDDKDVLDRIFEAAKYAAF